MRCDGTEKLEIAKGFYFLNEPIPKAPYKCFYRVVFVHHKNWNVLETLQSMMERAFINAQGYW